MLIKEYRIALPLTVEEYRIAQLYMIAKKSREESRGAGSGVEILVNEPYFDGPGGAGQYTHKIFHVGSHLPGWFKGLLPKSALIVEEKAWNAYPYTKTRYTCPFVEKFFLEIETKYLNNCGDTENVFDLNGSDLRSRVVDTINVVKDQLSGADYKSEEDPKIYISQKTKRGPLNESWLEEYFRESNMKSPSSSHNRDIMCAYKLCRVEFKYWGMQSKIEKFIHDMALRKTMLRAHRQAWAWQDEWVGLTMDDIRRLERETQEALAKKMGGDGNTPSTVVSSPAGSQCHLEDRTEGDDKVFEERVILPRPNGDTSDITPRLSPAWSPDNSPKPHKPHDLRISCDSSNLYSCSLDNRQRKWTMNSNRGLHSPDIELTLIRPELDMKKLHLHLQQLHVEMKMWTLTPTLIIDDGATDSTKSFDLQIANWRMGSCVRASDSSSDDEFFDCEEEIDSRSTMTKWSSLEYLNEEESTSPISDLVKEDTVFKPAFMQRVTTEHSPLVRPLQPSCSMDQSLPCSPTLSPAHHPCPITVLVLVVHGGSILDTSADYNTKKSDIATFRAALNLVCKQHYPNMTGHVAIRLVSCPQICLEAFGVLSSLSPYSFDASSSPSTIDGGSNPTSYTQDFMPISAIPLFATSSVEYNEIVSRVICNANQVFLDFLHSEEGIGFCGQVVLIGDSVGSIVAYDALCRPNQYGRFGSESSIPEAEPLSPLLAPKVNPLISISDGSGTEDSDFASRDKGTNENGKKLATNSISHSSHSHVASSGREAGDTHLTTTPLFRRRSSCSSEQSHVTKLEFDVSDLIMFGSPLGMVMAFRKIHSFDDKTTAPPRPVCTQVYNLFHPMDPLASRIEPLISATFSQLQPVKIARYAKYPMGDGHPCNLLECIHSNSQHFLEAFGSGVPTTPGGYGRRMSEASIQSAMSGVDSVPLQAISSLTQKWWGQKRLDYALYCPEGLTNFPINALPHIFHASYWESSDVIAFLLRQVSRVDAGIHHGDIEKEGNVFSPSQPREKWTKKRTSVKLKNVNANHRANDIIVKEGATQVLTARFMYGPIDMVALTGEKVDIHIMRDPPLGEWIYLTTELTDKSGRIIYAIPDSKSLGLGMYPVKMVVRGDHTSVDSYLVVVPPKTECVVFSIDGSFTASVSVTGRDPKVRAGAVDVVRHWQELGYLLIYITGRPDMQQQRVVSWLAQHNFPHGVVSFVDGLSTDPLRHKAEYLRHLVQDSEVVIHSAYGSSKDIAMYASVGLKPENIFIVGKVSKKQHAQAQILSDGYAAHLSDLLVHGVSRSAKGNARMVIPRGCFGLPGQNPGLRRRRSAKRTTSYPITTPSTSESMSRTRGVSPRPQSSRV